MKKELTLIEIRDDKPIREWASQLMSTRRQEAIASLEYEGVDQENCFLVALEGKTYLAFYCEGERLDQSDKTVQINKDHRAIMDAIRIRRKDAELLYTIVKADDATSRE